MDQNIEERIILLGLSAVIEKSLAFQEESIKILNANRVIGTLHKQASAKKKWWYFGWRK